MPTLHSSFLRSTLTPQTHVFTRARDLAKNRAIQLAKIQQYQKFNHGVDMLIVFLKEIDPFFRENENEDKCREILSNAFNVSTNGGGQKGSQKGGMNLIKIIVTFIISLGIFFGDAKAASDTALVLVDKCGERPDHMIRAVNPKYGKAWFLEKEQPLYIEESNADALKKWNACNLDYEQKLSLLHQLGDAEKAAKELDKFRKKLEEENAQLRDELREQKLREQIDVHKKRQFMVVLGSAVAIGVLLVSTVLSRGTALPGTIAAAAAAVADPAAAPEAPELDSLACAFAKLNIRGGGENPNTELTNVIQRLFGKQSGKKRSQRNKRNRKTSKRSRRNKH